MSFIKDIQLDLNRYFSKSEFIKNLERIRTVVQG
jgi:hypothetical protein